MAERGKVECLGCGEEKALTEYSVHSNSGLPRPYCKPCNAAKVRLSHYKVTKEFVDELLNLQGGVCAICGTAKMGRAGTPHIDHDHSCCPGARACGKCVRGLVCGKCNINGISWYETLPSHLKTFEVMNAYLADPPASRLRRGLSR